MKKYTIGVDVGGTNVKLGLIDFQGKICARSSFSTKSFTRNKEKLIKVLVSEIINLFESINISKKSIVGVGLGLPGLINTRDGIVTLLPNIPGWRNVPLKKILEKNLKIPVFLDNDVNLITLGEWKFGAGKGCDNLLCMTLGTGVGGGLILEGRLYRGEGFAAGEIGHMPLNEKGPDCNCGGFGCFERYVGNTFLQEKAGKLFKNKKISLEEVFALAQKDNPRALEFWEELATHVANGLIGVVNLLNPRLIIIGGGVSNSFYFLRSTIDSIIKKRTMKVQGKMVKVVKAKLGNDAGLLGSQVLIETKYNF